MSNSEWVELPDWKNESAYSFMKTMSPVELAWEALRRGKEYVRDWLLVQTLKAEHGSTWGSAPGGCLYNPAKYKNETVEDWLRRCVREGNTPSAQRLDVALCQKWKISELCDPYRHCPSDLIIGMDDDVFPREIVDPDEFATFIEIIEEEEVDRTAVRRGFAVLVFHLSPSHETSLEQARILLRKIAERDEVENQRQRSSMSTLIRNLRILDARRHEPPLTYQEIGKIFGNGGKDTLEKQAENLLKGALQLSRKGYLAIALKTGSPAL